MAIYQGIPDASKNFAAPLLRPFQRVIPLVGGIDLSPIALFFAIKLVQMMLASAHTEIFAILLPSK